MFTIISIMFIGIGIGYLMRNVQMLQKVEKSASLTILLLLFVLGVSIGSNRLIVDNLGRFGWQAAVLASLSITGSDAGLTDGVSPIFQERREEMKGSLTVVAFFCAGCLMGVANDFSVRPARLIHVCALCIDVPGGHRHREQQETEGAGQEPAAQNAFGADGHHCGNAVVLRLRQSAVEPMECVRLHGGG